MLFLQTETIQNMKEETEFTIPLHSNPFLGFVFQSVSLKNLGIIDKLLENQ